MSIHAWIARHAREPGFWESLWLRWAFAVDWHATQAMLDVVVLADGTLIALAEKDEPLPVA